jgi:hypothetical protein
VIRFYIHKRTQEADGIFFEKIKDELVGDFLIDGITVAIFH